MTGAELLSLLPGLGDLCTVTVCDLMHLDSTDLTLSLIHISLDRAVVQVDIAHAGDPGIDRVADNRVAVVLAGDIGAVRVQIPVSYTHLDVYKRQRS